jgi:hypothetical protein
MQTINWAPRARHTKIAVIHASNCDTKHVVPRELTTKRLHALMDCVWVHKGLSVARRSPAVLGWLVAKGWLEVRAGGFYATFRALPLVCALKRHGWYYWAGGDAPSFITEDGRAVSGFESSQELREYMRDAPERFVPGTCPA